MAKRLRRLGPYLVLSLFALIVAAPFLWIGSMAFKKQIDILMMKIIATPTTIRRGARTPRLAR